MKKTSNFFIILTIMVFLCSGCGHLKKTTDYLAKVETQDIEALTALSETQLKNWPFVSGTIQEALGPTRLELPELAELKATMAELDKLAGIGETDEGTGLTSVNTSIEYSDFDKGRAFGLRLLESGT